MKRALIVVGLGFGDEGKGLCTDWLCRSTEKPLVVRFNGGHQAGHTVVTDQGLRHVFSNFGSGTFQGAPTYWSSFCTFSPVSFLKECKALRSLSLNPEVFVDNLCPVTTHYDILFNQLIEKNRGKNPHGSCGVGFGATLERHDGLHKFYVLDLFYPEVCKLKLKMIRNYYQVKLKTAGIQGFDEYDHDAADRLFLQAVNGLEGLKNQEILGFVNEKEVFTNENYQTLIFEGAQGVLLDMDHGFFPHVTRSNTTSKNAMSLLERNSIHCEKEVFYVTRCYQTRHGAGPMSNEDYNVKLNNNEEETNKDHQFQGSFRTAPLDIDMFNYAIKCDSLYSNGIQKNLLVTCLDQINTKEIPVCAKGKIEKLSVDNLLNLFCTEINKSYCCFSETGSNLIYGKAKISR